MTNYEHKSSFSKSTCCFDVTRITGLIGQVFPLLVLASAQMYILPAWKSMEIGSLAKRHTLQPMRMLDLLEWSWKCSIGWNKYGLLGKLSSCCCMVHWDPVSWLILPPFKSWITDALVNPKMTIPKYFNENIAGILVSI